MQMNVPLEDRLSACMNSDGCDIDMMADLLKELRVESNYLASRMTQINELIVYLEGITMDSDDMPDFTGMSLTDAAQKCLDEGCPIDMVVLLIEKLAVSSRELQATGNNHDYVDQLIGALNTQRDRAQTAGRTAGML